MICEEGFPFRIANILMKYDIRIEMHGKFKYVADLCSVTITWLMKANSDISISADGWHNMPMYVEWTSLQRSKSLRLANTFTALRHSSEWERTNYICWLETILSVALSRVITIQAHQCSQHPIFMTVYVSSANVCLSHEGILHPLLYWFYLTENRRGRMGRNDKLPFV